MSATATLILTSAVVATVVSAIVGGVFTMWNDHLRREHETTIRSEDRQHERELKALDDQRAQRDRRAQRIYDNVHQITQFVVEVGDQVSALRVRPQDYLKSHEPIAQAILRLKRTQPALMLDAETAILFSRSVDAIQALNVWFASIENREEAKKAKRERIGDMTKEVFDRGEELTKLLDAIVTESREALAEAEAALI